MKAIVFAIEYKITNKKPLLKKEALK